MMNKLEETLMSAAQVAGVLSVSKRSIFRLNASGKIPKPVMIGGSVRWRKPEIMEWVAAGAPDRRKWEAMQRVK